MLDGKLFVMGGRRYNAALSAYETLDITIVYDPATDAWTRRAPMPRPRIGIAATRVLLNGQARIEVVGGSVPGQQPAVRAIDPVPRLEVLARTSRPLHELQGGVRTLRPIRNGARGEGRESLH